MKSINLKDYVEVRERIAAFYERYPTGSIRTEMVRLQDDLVVFKALVYRDPEDPHPTTGWAYERPGSSRVNESHFVENCETSAIGRALANLGFAGGRRPSREEMAKVQRMLDDGSATRGDGARRRRAPEATTQDRIRRLLREVRLSPSKRDRIEAKLAAGLSDQEAHDLEAYLLALRPRAS